MKKSPFLFLSLLTLLTACSGGAINFGYTNEEHSAGVDNSSYSQKTYVDSYNYFAGDTIDETNENVANMTFKLTNQSYFDMSKEEIESLVECDVNDIFDHVIDASLTSTTENVGLFVGTGSTLRDGYLTLGFKVAIKDLKIEACPYNSVDYSWNKEDEEIDKNVAVAVNNSGYVKLSSIKNEETGEIISTSCRYHLASDTKEIKIKVGQKRAYIRKIVLYY